MENPIAEGDFLLEKFPMKGGWTYAEIPDVYEQRKKPFGWVKVKGSIDDFTFEDCKLMPMGPGRMFMPVKASIQKKIGKKAGDKVRIVLYLDDVPLRIPEEIMECFEYEPAHVKERFFAQPESIQKIYRDWILNAKRAETKANRLSIMMYRLDKGLPVGFKLDEE